MQLHLLTYIDNMAHKTTIPVQLAVHYVPVKLTHKYETQAAGSSQAEVERQTKGLG